MSINVPRNPTNVPRNPTGSGGAGYSLPSVRDLVDLAGTFRPGTGAGKTTVSQTLTSQNVAAVNPNIVVNVLGDTSDLGATGNAQGGAQSPSSGAYAYDVPVQPPALFGTPGRASVDIPFASQQAGAAAVSGLFGGVSPVILLAGAGFLVLVLTMGKKGKK